MIRTRAFDNGRLVGGVAAASLLAMLALWVVWHHNGTIGYGALVDRPEDRDGQSISLSLVRVAERKGSQHYVVEKGALRFDVYGDANRRTVGEDISVGGTWDGSRVALEEAWVEPRSGGRDAKRVLGILGTLLAVLLWGGGWRWTAEGWVPRG